MNILFDSRKVNQKPGFIQKTHIKYSQQRYNYILQQIFQKMKPDVIVFNQVCKIFYQKLKHKPQVQKNYLITPCQYNPYTKFDVYGNMIIVNKLLNPVALHLYKVNHLNQPMPIAFLSINQKLVSFTSAHLLAFQKNIKQRKQQLTDVCSYLRSFDKVDSHVLMGDMNFHHQSEQETIQSLHLKDVWVELHDLNIQPGYTFDAVANLMINELYWGFQQRRMRLDRILVSQKSQIKQKTLQFKSCEIVFNKPMFALLKQTQFDGWYKSLTSFAFDIFSKNAHRVKEDYLFASDHFGLLAELYFH